MGGVLSPGSLRRALPFPESALRPVPPLRLSWTLEPSSPTRALSSACQFPASPESTLLSPASPHPLLLLSLGEPGQPLPRSPSDRRRPYPPTAPWPRFCQFVFRSICRCGWARAGEGCGGYGGKNLESGPKQKRAVGGGWVLVPRVDAGCGRYPGKLKWLSGVGLG